MPSISDNNKRIAKNTIFLYVRMLFSMGVSLYTSRVVLSVLGVSDFGLNSIVASTIALFSFLKSSMDGATSRFLTFELGKKDIQKLSKTFSASLNIHIIIAFIIAVLGETVGLWYLDNKMVIPEGRVIAAHWVYHLSIISTMITITQVPYSASIISHERMNVYAYIEIFRVLLQLVIVYLLVVGNLDKLILYAILTLCVSIIISLVYRIYCVNHFVECRYKFEWNKKITISLFSFIGWDLYGSICLTAKDNGVNLILNLFWGTIVNAACSIGGQVSSAVNSVASNFLFAVNPQIVKYYAENRINEMQNLAINATKFSFLLLFMFSLPVIIEINFILSLWLNDVPPYTNIFCQLFLVMSLISVFWRNINFMITATGKIKSVSFVTGTIYILIPIISYLAFKIYGNTIVYFPFLISIFIYIISFIVRLIILHSIIHQFSIIEFIKKAVINCCSVAVIVIIISLTIHYYLKESFLRLISVALSSLLTTMILSYYFMINKSLRKEVKNKMEREIFERVKRSNIVNFFSK